MSLSSIFGGIAAYKGAKNERATQDANLERFRDDRQFILDEFARSRGSDGTAFLPEYFGTGKDSYETQLANDVRRLYNATAIDPAQYMQQYRTTAGAFVPMQLAARNALGGIFDGNYTEARLQNAAPVAAARTNLARTQKQGNLEGLQERVNALNVANAKKGYSGTGSFAQNRLLNATIGARQNASAVDAAAQLANVSDTRDIQDYGLNLKLANLSTPYQMAAADLAYLDMPMNAAIQAQLNRMRPMESFRIGTAMPPIPMTPPQKAIPTSNQIFWQTTAQATKEFEDLAKQAMAMYFGGGMGGMGGGAGGGGTNYLSGNFAPMAMPQAQPYYNFTL